MNESSTPEPSLDRLLNALRSAATAEELSGEAAAISAMASAIADSSEGTSAMKLVGHKPVSRPTFSRARRVVGLTAIGVLGLAGVAAAGAGVFIPDNRPSHDSVPAVTEVDDTASETTIADDQSAETTAPEDATLGDSSDNGREADDDDGTDPTVAAVLVPTDTPAVECADGNHGKTVSSVAKATEPGPGHGAAVSAAAQSDCGKDSTEPDSASVETTAPSDDEATPTDERSNGNKPEDPGSQGNGHKPADPGSQGNGHKPADPGSQGNGHKPVDPSNGNGG